MANFKRKRSKNQRSGCLLCKPWKVNGFARRRRKDGECFSDHRRRSAAEREIRHSQFSPIPSRKATKEYLG